MVNAAVQVLVTPLPPVPELFSLGELLVLGVLVSLVFSALVLVACVGAAGYRGRDRR